MAFTNARAMQVLLCFIGIKLPVSFSVLSRGYFSCRLKTVLK